MVAEGVETDADRMILRSLDCMIGQGFLFSAALPMQEALAFDAGRADSSAAAAFFDPAVGLLRKPQTGNAA